MIGLIVAFAGYLVHEVHREVSFMLLGSLEAIDSEYIASLIEYFSEYTPYLILALLPEDASRIEGKYAQIAAAELNRSRSSCPTDFHTSAGLVSTCTAGSQL